ncbi:MAG: signal peptidase I [Treponemataceae bacterium]|nr:MAG: signal peptidase I [Treponemataceae bacterium]
MAQSRYDYSFRLRQELHRKIRRVAFFIAAVLVCLALFLRFILFSVVLYTVSMEPNIKSGTALFVSPLFSVRPLMPFFELNRGDVVLALPYERQEPLLSRALNAVVSFATFQQIRYAASGSESMFITRVIGFPGDTIFMKDYQLYVKPADANQFLTEFELRETDYEIQVNALPEGWNNTLGAAGSFSEMTLKDDEYFLLCDNRTVSADSRIWGPVRGSRIQGRALLIYFPFDAISLL